ncbi:unnamed protein product, partial [Rotaria sordida]
RTTLVIAHRLSTIRNADKIIVIHKGNVVEEGDHKSLMNARGTYFTLVEQQNLRKAEEEEEEEQKQDELNLLVVPNQTAEIQLGFERKRASSIGSIASSAMNALYGKQKNSTADENAVEEKDTEV